MFTQIIFLAPNFQVGSSCLISSIHYADFDVLSILRFNEGMVQALAELKERLSPSDLVIGNGLQNYDFNAGDGNPTFDLFVDVVDGFCMEHVTAFEGVNVNTQEQPFIKIEALQNLIELRNLLVSAGKLLLAR